MCSGPHAARGIIIRPTKRRTRARTLSQHQFGLRPEGAHRAEEKGQEAKDHLDAARGPNEPAYLKLNPNGVVPTLIHDGEPIIESSLILYYIDDVFPEPPLMPKEPRQRHLVRMYNKLIDEYVHNSCTILTFATAFRPAFLKMPPRRLAGRNQQGAAQAPRGVQAQRDRARARLRVRRRRAGAAPEAAVVDGELAEERSVPGRRSFSNADCAVIPYILRLELLKLGGMWDQLPVRRRMVGRDAHAAVGQDGDLRSHDRGRLPRPSKILRPTHGRRCRSC